MWDEDAVAYFTVFDSNIRGVAQKRPLSDKEHQEYRAHSLLVTRMVGTEKNHEKGNNEFFLNQHNLGRE
jgi:hypothetical protein